jgi:transcription termination factor 2
MPDPAGLRTPLKPHQRHALAWMIWRETQAWGNGGILADEMGLGKTLAAIALIVAQKQNEAEPDDMEEKLNSLERTVLRELQARSHAFFDTFGTGDRGLVASRATLVVAPASLIYQWEEEVKKHVKSGRLRVHIYHGSKREASAERLVCACG